MALEFSAAFDLLKSLASKVGGKTEVTNEDVEKMMKDADTDGDGISISNNEISVDTTFTEASTRENIASGDTFSTILGKIKKLFTDLKTVAFSGSASDLTYDNDSSGLSATDTQGAIDEVVSNVETIIQESVFTVEESGGVWYLYWHGATGECPWSVTQSGTDYELNFTYTTA